jgi:hypothetical protein
MSSSKPDNIRSKIRRWLQNFFQRSPDEPAQEFDYTEFLISVFLYLRQRGGVLGVDELQAGLRVAEEKWERTEHEELKVLMRLVWCHSLVEEQVFEEAWTRAMTRSRLDKVQENKQWNTPQDTFPKDATSLDDKRHENQPIDDPVGPLPEKPSRWEPLPFQVPFSPLPLDERFELGSSWPISRRQMMYAWRYLRRPVADGPQDMLDIEGTIAHATQQGLFFEPVYRRRERNHAHLVLLIDQDGSMMPFHRFTRDLVETARYESEIEHVDVYYFHNVPMESVYIDPHMTRPVNLHDVLDSCTTSTSVLLASDAGAARGGGRQLERIRATTAFLRKLEMHTPLIAWLNPMPRERWAGSSAQVIANLLHGHMFQMDPDGFSNAIDVVRGQPFRHSW